MFVSLNGRDFIDECSETTHCYTHRSSESNILPSFDPETVLQTGECRSVLSVCVHVESVLRNCKTANRKVISVIF